ncbi:MAG: flagellar motor switch protein FliN [Planctomycetota bacterium]
MSDADKQSVADDIVAQALAEAQAELSAMASDVDAASPDADRSRGLDLLGDVDLDVTIELGRTHMLVEDVLRLGSGSVVELDKLAGDPVDVYVNGRRVARGEVIVLNDNFCIRVSEVVTDLEEQAEQAGLEQAGGTGDAAGGSGGGGGETSDADADAIAQAALDAMG